MSLVLMLSSCQSNPMDWPETMELAEKPSLPRTVGIRLEVRDPECFGAAAEWAESLTRHFQELNVCTATLTDQEPSFGEADMVVKVVISKIVPPFEPAIATEPALLDFMAWSAVPLLPWFIDDVEIDPAVSAMVTWTLRPQDEGPLGPNEVSIAPISTSLRDRYPLLSWPTAGALIMPPFVFREGDKDHLAQSLGARIRSEMAIEIARIIKTSRADNELLWNLWLEEGKEGAMLVFNADADLGKVWVSVDGQDDAKSEFPIKIGSGDTNEQRLHMQKMIQGAGPGNRFLKIEALGHSGRRLRYSLPLTYSPRAVALDARMAR